ncbi:cilia- and flagella-associated protein 97 isoform x1 [Limosa lapponica baueri]|uniref:Cilia-and flagella-associated protein 97 isoform x1 n=1 Tax=Limosa lapponica baueri TaxID=1758121 RepID=A0A2I0T5R6_LIMLA|nr:cilia- and flagella-associated protein 97 isoform x1 [Limosa lapponica baueri]
MDQFEDVSDGEVDHAFFDSDFEENKKKAEENGECIEKGNTTAAVDDSDLVSNSKDAKCCEEESEEKQKDLQEDQPLENNPAHPGDASSLSVSLVAENAGTSGVTFAASRATQENVPAGIPKIVKEREEDYYTDEEDSSDDGKAQKRNACRNALLSPKQKFKSAMKLAEGKPNLSDYLEESEDTVTDVTPLSTPDISPIQSFELAASNDKKLKIKRQENVNPELYDSEFDRRYSRKVLHDAMDLNQLLKDLKSVFRQLTSFHLQCPVAVVIMVYDYKNYCSTLESDSHTT